MSFEKNLSTVFGYIENYVNDDNIITEAEFQEIQKLKSELNVRSQDIYKYRKADIERILYLQFYILFLDDEIDNEETKEVEYYKDIFGYNDAEINELRKRVWDEKLAWKNRTFKSGDPIAEKEKRNRNIPGSIKKIIWDRDGGKCVSCGSTTDLEFDHDIPFSKGGSNSTDNIRLLCKTCNRKKSNKIGFFE